MHSEYHLRKQLPISKTLKNTLIKQNFNEDNQHMLLQNKTYPLTRLLYHILPPKQTLIKRSKLQKRSDDYAGIKVAHTLITEMQTITVIIYSNRAEVMQGKTHQCLQDIHLDSQQPTILYREPGEGILR